MSKNSTITTLDNDADAVAAEVTADAKTAAKVVKGNGNDEALSGKRMRIKVFESEKDSEKGPLFVGLNGVGYQIPRGIVVDVPEEVVEVLDNAIMKVYPTEGGLVTGEKEVPRHAYQQVRGGN